MSKLTCPKCDSEYLDQGIDGKIICHGCRRFLMLMDTWILPTNE
jgi:hypothetical protein